MSIIERVQFAFDKGKRIPRYEVAALLCETLRLQERVVTLEQEAGSVAGG